MGRAALPERLTGAEGEPTQPRTAVCPALEAELRAIEAEVNRRTTDPRLRQAARNLLDDCRVAFLAGQAESARASARHLAQSIPAFLTARGL
jgi:hypothetical protein